MIKISDSTTYLKVKVIPRARKTEYVGIMDDRRLKIRLRSVPEDGQANKELIDFLEKETGVSWEISSGWTSARKGVRRV